ncbi:MAG: 2-C-methyl-D-erythritol 2,4-cyclodiphosphate synthase [Candidatus Pelagibacter sp.]|nr:2-C-methyl-D-erythritol 2,4-cyclodiphosphate synthase [Candidatus Pelagibacter sp.]RPG11435.1 MAG: 2-C-methyl-D-erythritol 2,4-cyclodiphosphate synthase [Pelagibacteraceae bacterium TMED170]|tara:strand:+ start:8888 stop:10033 length:1146 start_codon:yes stop_codon:yes gene_type:complete
MSFCLILLAAGKSNRFQSNIAKPYHKIAGKTLLEITLKKMSDFRQITKTIIVHAKKDTAKIKKLNLKNIQFVIGGSTRQISTFKALKILNKQSKISKVLIHDAARPNFSLELLSTIIKNMKKFKAVVPTVKIHDAIKQKYDSGKFEYIIGKNRNDLFLTQTPQAFYFKEIYNLHKNSGSKYFDDDISLYMNLNKVKFIKGEKNNFKITDQTDFHNLKNIYKSKLSVGIGFDIHRLIPKRKLYLAGLKIKSHLGTLGHSDGDPVLHSIIDSILGACKMGDIGQMFSDKNKKFKNIRSTILLRQVISKIKTKGYFVNNLDINIISQTPKIKKYKNKIINNISKLCEISKNQINVKGKTTEKLGIIGKEKAIACEVITSVTKYD